MIFDFIDPFYFLIALGVGLLYVYVTSPTPEIVIKYPTPDNAGKITYIDDAGVCYRYRTEPAPCPEPSTGSVVNKVTVQQI